MGLAMAIPSEIGHRRSNAEQCGFDKLTQMEREVMRVMVVERITANKDIATRLIMSPRTVQTHLANIFEKTRNDGVYDRATLCLLYAEYLRPLDVEST